MAGGSTIVLIILILCVSILFGIYMSLCSKNEVKMFSDPKYDKRIKILEKELEKLKEAT